MFKSTATLFGLFLLLGTVVGCGGSSVDLPVKVFSDDVYAIQWINFSELEPDDAVKMLAGLADDMSDDQPKARLWVSAQADALHSSYADRWEVFTEAGGIGMLTVHTAKAEGEGDQPKRLIRERFVLVHVVKDTSTDDLEKALADFAKDDGNAKIKFTKVDDTDGRWFWLTREDISDNAAKLPSDGNEANAAAFKALLAEADKAAVVTAWRSTDAIRTMIQQDLDSADDRNLSESDKQRLKEAKDITSIVLAVRADGPSGSATVMFEDGELSKSFVEHHNDGLIEQRYKTKVYLSNSENPPHPSVIDDMFQERQVKSSGRKITLKMDDDAIDKAITVVAATRGQGGMGSTSPDSLLPIHSQLQVPSTPGVPGCYQIRFRDR